MEPKDWRSKSSYVRGKFFLDPDYTTQFRIMGTFPNGVQSLCATPLIKNSTKQAPWNTWFSWNNKDTAKRWIDWLNQMDESGYIDWDSGPYPKVEYFRIPLDPFHYEGSMGFNYTIPF